MKTWISLIAMVLALFILIVYLFLPSTSTIVNLSGIGANQYAVIRALNQQDKWDSFSRGHCRISEPTLNGANVNIAYNDKVFASHLIVIPITPDSVNVRWECKLPPPHNPFSRITNFLNARELKSNMTATIDREFKKLCEDPGGHVRHDHLHPLHHRYQPHRHPIHISCLSGYADRLSAHRQPEKNTPPHIILK